MDDDYMFDEEKEPEKESFNISATDGEHHEGDSSGDSIHKSMFIADVVNEYPEIVPLIMKSGLHCIGCGAAMFETLEEGFMAHGMDNGEIERIIKELNDYIKENSKDV
jgi:hybrid cluster-associated redox disulfide protein